MYIHPYESRKVPCVTFILLQDVSFTVEKNMGEIEEEENVALSKTLHILC